jgi:hypothetical protein
MDLKNGSITLAGLAPGTGKKTSTNHNRKQQMTDLFDIILTVIFAVLISAFCYIAPKFARFKLDTKELPPLVPGGSFLFGNMSKTIEMQQKSLLHSLLREIADYGMSIKAGVVRLDIPVFSL